jgi:branched-chain amino acid transport system substrate-binding protein
MHQYRQQIVEQLSIDIDLFLEQLNAGSTKLSELDKNIVCQLLIGRSRQHVAKTLNLPSQSVGDRLNKYIYPKVADLMQVEQEQIAGNWTTILNFLIHPSHGYRLNPPPQLNNDNFQGSFGRQLFLYASDQKIVQVQIEGTRFYQQGLYYQALKCFLTAWKQELEVCGVGNPEVLIYINNCLIEYQHALLQQRKVQIYTLAVVVPFHHNQGLVAAEILRGIAQNQLQVNLQCLDKISSETEVVLNEIKPSSFFNLNDTSHKIALRLLIVNDPNNLHDPYNQTAETLAKLAPQLNLTAIIGHYSSEMTRKALHFYSRAGIVLVNASSTSSQLSNLSTGEALSFFRLTTQDSVNAVQLADYLIGRASVEHPSKVAIVYNNNSSYSTSYRNVIKQYLDQYQDYFIFLKECDYISKDYYQIQAYLEHINQSEAEIIIIIPDGGIEPNSLNNAGLISRLNLKKCLIAGSATFYQENVLHWIHEQSQHDSIWQNAGQIVACIPWHWHSQKNGCSSSNRLAQNFCQTGAQLWGEENLTWRSATAFDSMLVILKSLERHSCHSSQGLLEQMNQFFKEHHKAIQGVTGDIRFEQGGDRINPPSEIVSVTWNAQQQRWKWAHLQSV